MTQPGRPVRFVARGTVVTKVPAGQSMQMDLGGEWRELGLPLTGTPVVTSPTGSFRMAGTLDRYRLSADTRIATAHSENLQARVRRPRPLRRNQSPWRGLR